MSTTTPSITTAPHTPAPASFEALGGLKYVPNMPSLGIAEMMEYLSAYMNKSDTDLRSKMADMKDRNAKADALHGIIEKLNTIKSHAEADGNITNAKDVEEMRDLLATYKDLLPLLSGPARDALTSLSNAAHCDYHAVFKGGLHALDCSLPPGTTKAADGSFVGPDGAPIALPFPGAAYDLVETYSLKKDDVDGALKSLSEETSALGSSNELEMIQLQSAVSARGNLLSMVSNMVKSFDDNAKSIVGNMR